MNFWGREWWDGGQRGAEGDGKWWKREHNLEKREKGMEERYTEADTKLIKCDGGRMDCGGHHVSETRNWKQMITHFFPNFSNCGMRKD